MLLLMLISKKVATPMSKGSKKHSRLFTNVISKNVATPISIKAAAPLQKQIFKKWPPPVLPFTKGKQQSSFRFSKGDVRLEYVILQ